MRLRILFIFSLLLLTGCERPSAERHYQEVSIEAPASAPMMGDDPHAGLGLDIPIIQQHTRKEKTLAWDAPPDWTEEAGGGMRLATFKSKRDAQAIDVSIVSLGGMAGGAAANLDRWAKQINLEISPQELEQFINSAPKIKTQSGAEAILYDFSTLRLSNGSTKTMAAAMIVLGEQTVFVKMTGSPPSIQSNMNAFRQLTQSIRTL